MAVALRSLASSSNDLWPYEGGAGLQAVLDMGMHKMKGGAARVLLSTIVFLEIISVVR